MTFLGSLCSGRRGQQEEGLRRTAPVHGHSLAPRSACSSHRAQPGVAFAGDSGIDLPRECPCTSPGDSEYEWVTVIPWETYMKEKEEREEKEMEKEKERTKIAAQHMQERHISRVLDEVQQRVKKLAQEVLELLHPRDGKTKDLEKEKEKEKGKEREKEDQETSKPKEDLEGMRVDVCSLAGKKKDLEKEKEKEKGEDGVKEDQEKRKLKEDLEGIHDDLCSLAGSEIFFKGRVVAQVGEVPLHPEPERIQFLHRWQGFGLHRWVQGSL